MKSLLLLLIFTILSFPVVGQSNPLYQLWWDEGCKDKCIIFALVKTKHYDAANMRKLAKQFAEKYKGKDVVYIDIFDDKKLIEAFIESKREIQNISSDRRGWFVHIADCGDMLFYKPEKNKLKAVKLHWEKSARCNKPSAI